MEIHSALTLATFVVDFVELSTKLIAGEVDLYYVIDARSKEHVDLTHVTSILSEISKKIERQLHYLCKSSSSRVLSIAQDANQMAKELMTALGRLIEQKHPSWESCVETLRILWSEDHVNNIETTLNTFREDLVLCIIVEMR